MTCSCRTAPLRSFLSGLAQVHRLDPSLSQPLLRNWSRAALQRTQHRQVSAVRHFRGFHATARAAQEATAAASDSADSTPTAAAPTPPTTDSAVSEGIVESTSVQQPKKKKKQRWREMDESQLAKVKEEKAKLKEKAAKNQEKKAKKKAKMAQSKAAGSDGSGTIIEEKGV